MIINNNDLKQNILTALADKEMLKTLNLSMYNSKSVNDIIRESDINYKINITGTPNITGAYIHTGKNGENGEAIADLLKDSKKDVTENELGVIIRGEILEPDLVGPMKGKSLKDVIIAITDGPNYVSINTPANTIGEIRGQIEVGNTGG
jgi:hypothetical protein